MKAMTVGDLMTKTPITITGRDNLAKAYNIMNDYRIRHLPVVDEEGELVGLITQRDLARSALFAAGELSYGDEMDFLESTKVNEVLTVDPVVVEESTALDEAGLLLIENKYGCLPVLNGSEVIGIITETDFVKFVIGLKDEDSESAGLEQTPIL